MNTDDSLKNEYLARSQDQEAFEEWLLTLDEHQLDAVSDFMETHIYSSIAKVYGVPSVLC